MKNKDIYTAALHLLSQSAEEGENEDYEERAPFFIASFCSEVAEIDAAMRKLLELPAIARTDSVWLSLDSEFPLLDRFASVASRYLAAMLVLDEDEALSDKLYGLYCEGISLIRNEIPCAIEKIINKYI